MTRSLPYKTCHQQREKRSSISQEGKSKQMDFMIICHGSFKYHIYIVLLCTCVYIMINDEWFIMWPWPRNFVSNRNSLCVWLSFLGQCLLCNHENEKSHREAKHLHNLIGNITSVGQGQIQTAAHPHGAFSVR